MNKGVIIKNGMYNSIGTATRMVLGIVIIPLLIRAIGLDEYGLWTLITSVVGLVELAEIGLSVSTTYFVSRDLSAIENSYVAQTLTVSLGVVLAMATLAAGLLWLGSNTVVSLLPALSFSQQVVAGQALRIGALIVWSDLLRRVLIGVEQAYQRYDLTNMLVTGHAISNSLGLLAIAMRGGTTLSLVRWQAGLSMTMLIAHVLIVRWLLRGISLRPVWDKQRVKEIVRYSVFTWLTSLSSALFSKADRLVIGSSLGTETLAVYGAITSITAKINQLSAVPVQPLLPAISGLAAQKQRDQEELRDHVQQALRINSSIALGLSAMLFIFAPLVMVILLSDAVTQEIVLAFRLAVVIYGLYSLNAVGYYILLGVNAVKRLMIIQMASAVVALSMIYAASWTSSLLGVIMGNAGYLGLGVITYQAAKCSDIEMRSWLTWIRFPVALFATVIALSLLLPPMFEYAIWFLGLGTLVALILWFFMNHKSLVMGLFNS